MLINLLKDFYRSSQLKPKQVLDHYFRKCKSSHSSSLITLNENYYSDEKDNFELFGIPFIAKNNFCSKSTITTAGSKCLSRFEASYDAAVIKCLMNEGASLIGTSFLDEFAMGSAGTNSKINNSYPLNPWSERNVIAGGSSSGSAVSIARGLSVFSIGTDTGGSTRIPAAFCGISGFKPSFGLISRHGLIPLSNCFDCPSIFAQYTEDVGIVFQTLLSSKENRNDATLFCQISDKDIKLNNPKIGIVPEFFDQTHPKIVSTIDRALEMTSKNLKCSIVPQHLPTTDFILPIYKILSCVEIASNMSPYDGIEFGTKPKANSRTFSEKIFQHRSELIGDEVKTRILSGNYISLLEKYEIQIAKKLWRLWCNEIHKIFQEVDFLIVPTVPIPPPTIEEYEADENSDFIIDYFTLPFNLAGLPCISIPIGKENFSPDEQLPIGLQIISEHGTDLKLLHFANKIEKIVKFIPLIDPVQEINDLKNKVN